MMGETRAKAVAAGVAAGMIGAMGLLSMAGGKASARAVMADYTLGPSPSVSRVVGHAKGDARGARDEMRGLYRQGRLTTGADYAAAAKLLLNSGARDDLALAHDLAIAGLSLGDRESRALVACSEDRLFKSVGLGERYGTLGGASPLTREHRALLDVARPFRAEIAVAE